MFTGYIFAVVLLAFVWWFYDRVLRYPTLPPGPFRWPIIANLPWVLDCGFIPLTDYARQKKASVLTLQVGSDRLIMITGPECMPEVAKKTCSGRPPNNALNTWYGKVPKINELRGFGFANGEYWRYHRKLAVSVLLSHNKIVKRSTLMERECGEFIKTLKEFAQNNTPFKIQPLYAMYTGNVTLTMLMGLRFSDADDRQYKILHEAFATFTEAIRTHPANAFPFLRRIPGIMSKLEQAKKHRDLVLRPVFDEHIETYKSYIDHPRDYLDILLHRRDLDLAKGIESETLSYDSLFGVMDFMYFNGLDTTSNIMDWVTVCFVNNPEVQEKVYQEIKGLGHLPTFDDFGNLPYFNATIFEVIRYHCPIPLIPRKTLAKTKLGGYELEPNTPVFVNLWALSHNPDVWDEPDIFRPERFLPGGEYSKQSEKLIFTPFGFGIRECIGQDMAKEIYSLFLARLLYYFKIESKNGRRLSEDPVDGLILKTKNEDLVVRLR